ncbi:hypothetical protein PY365_14110 [Roseiarcaceae bacterium H3SJ34-1]|uniref:hypothetical protein n=1 Tax=Terripilifer ovatus TaxID=3032367 RepID=UPI003AB97BE5|nr:hypothetical protein [Roseiarcaceae bacterium H3SJ34-1]
MAYFFFRHIIAFGVQAIPGVEHCGLPAESRLQTWQAFVHSAHEALRTPHASTVFSTGLGMGAMRGASAKAAPASAVKRRSEAARIIGIILTARPRICLIRCVS